VDGKASPLCRVRLGRRPLRRLRRVSDDRARHVVKVELSKKGGSSAPKLVRSGVDCGGPQAFLEISAIEEYRLADSLRHQPRRSVGPEIQSLRRQAPIVGEVPNFCSLLDRRRRPRRRWGDQRRPDEIVFEARRASSGQGGPCSGRSQDTDHWRRRPGSPRAGLLQGGRCAAWKRRSAVRSLYVATAQIRGFAARPRRARCGQSSTNAPTDEGRSTGAAQPAAIGLRDREAARAAISRGAIGAASRTA
jgi:hypothetical protein